MTDINAAVVQHLASLARLDLSEAEVAEFVPQLSEIVTAVSTLSQVVGADVPATSHPLPLTNVFRADTHNPAVTLTVEQALSGAPEREGDQFKVGPILA